MKYTFTNKAGYEDQGIISGLLRAYRVEFKKGDKLDWGMCKFTSTTFEKYVENDASYENGVEFSTERYNGWEPTGNVMFCGYWEEYMAEFEGKWEEFVREVKI